jgi:ABC-type multidrug transport system permease subunit
MIVLDCVGILLVLVSAMVFNALQTSAPLWAEAMAIVSSLLAALAAGVGVGWLVRTAFWQGGFDIISGLIYQLERA